MGRIVTHYENGTDSVNYILVATKLLLKQKKQNGKMAYLKYMYYTVQELTSWK